MLQDEDRVTYVRPVNSKSVNPKLGQALIKANPASDLIPDYTDIFEFFDLDQNDVYTIRECHRVAAGIEGQIYIFSLLSYAYNCLILCKQAGCMNEEQVAHAQHWVKILYMGLMQRSYIKPVLEKKKDESEDKAKKGFIEADEEEEEEENEQ